MIIPGITPSKRGIRNVQRRSNVLQDATVREFGGGLNVIDNELNLDTRFAVVLDNMVREEDGSMGVRWGTKLFADIGTAASMAANDYIVNTFYFQNSSVTVLSDGRLTRTLGDGTTTVIWNTAIASGLVGSPPGWGPTDFASFAVFNGKLIVCNGTDKPLEIDFNNAPPVQYLADAATGSNLNVPICRYVIAVNRYIIMAGDALYPDRVHISNRDTAGTWFGDAAPNDGTFIDIGKVGIEGDQAVTGLSRYRKQVIVGFLNASVLGTLGNYNSDGVHTPDFNDVIEGFGCHSHRSLVNLGKDVFSLDHLGIASIARSLFSGETEPKRVSELIDPLINKNINRLLEADTLLGVHAVYNSNDKQYMCFVPNHSEFARDMVDDPVQVLFDRQEALRLNIPTHNLSVGDKVTLSGLTAFNTLTVGDLNKEHVVTRVINDDLFEIEPDGISTNQYLALTGGGTVGQWMPMWTETYGYVYTFIGEMKIRAWARFRNWRWRASSRSELGSVFFADDKRLFVYGNQNAPLYQDFIGTDDVTDIEFAWEWPWADFDARANVKHTRYIHVDTAGTALFDLMLFVDLLYQQNGLLIPHHTLRLIGGDSGGYGISNQPYGGGRRTSEQRLYEFPARGKLFKLRFQGSTNKPLRIIAVSLLYQRGGIRR